MPRGAGESRAIEGCMEKTNFGWSSLLIHYRFQKLVIKSVKQTSIFSDFASEDTHVADGFSTT